MRNSSLAALAISMLLMPTIIASAETVKVARSEDKPLQETNDPLQSNDAAESISSATKPTVILSQRHKSMNSKSIGDKIDGASAVDIQGKQSQLSDLLGDRLTVLIFWNEQSLLALEQFRRIPVDILGPYAKQRVKVIAANVGGDQASTKKLTGDASDKIVSLVDKDAKLFEHFATDAVPRTYLLDKAGTILWFDMEYSQSTTRELSNAIQYFLQNQ